MNDFMLLNSYEHWNDDKLQPVSQPQLLDYPIGSIIAHPNPITKVSIPYGIPTHIEGSVFGTANFDTAVLTQLTPPHSPPRNAASPTTGISTPAAAALFNATNTESATDFNNVLSQISAPTATAPAPLLAITTTITTPQPQPQPQDQPQAAAQNFNNFNNINNWIDSVANNNNNNSNNANLSSTNNSGNDLYSLTAPYLSNDEIAREIDEIVNSRAKELFDVDESDSQFSYATPSQSADSNNDTNDATDEEWMPSGHSSSYAPSSASSSPLRHLTSGDEQMFDLSATVGNISANGNNTACSTAKPKKRTRPYGRGVEDRKIRKKEQNKNAATRYRQKKKLEMEIVLNEEQHLTERNEELRRTLAERKREAKYLKNLIREFYKKKN